MKVGLRPPEAYRFHNKLAVLGTAAVYVIALSVGCALRLTMLAE